MKIDFRGSWQASTTNRLTDQGSGWSNDYAAANGGNGGGTHVGGAWRFRHGFGGAGGTSNGSAGTRGTRSTQTQSDGQWDNGIGQIIDDDAGGRDGNGAVSRSRGTPGASVTGAAANVSVSNNSTTFNPNGGTFPTNTPVAEFNNFAGRTGFITHLVPVRPCYTFVGWNTDRNATSGLTAGQTFIYASTATTYWAIWRKTTEQAVLRQLFIRRRYLPHTIHLLLIQSIR